MISFISLGLVLATGAAVAQSGGKAMSFEVASVRPAAPITSKEGKERIGASVSGDRVVVNYTTLAELVRIAYRVKPFQVTGPDWTNSERFDVQAKMPAGASQEQMPEMLQTLLRERFQLTLHRENKEHSVYALVVGRSGLQLAEAVPGAEPPAAAASKGGGAIRFNRKMTMAALADFAGRFVDRPVTDLTGLQATYQVDLEIPMEELIRAKGAAEEAMRSGTSGPDAAGSTIFSAMQKFGLRLEPRKIPLEVLVIEHADRLPVAN